MNQERVMAKGGAMGNIERFDRIAEHYDTPERIHSAKIIAEQIRTVLIDGAQKHVMEYGCGTGLVGLELVHNVKTMLFVDASCNMVQRVRQKLDLLQIKNAKAACFNLETQKLHALQADYIIVAQTLLHIKEIEPVLSGLFHFLPQGGHLIIVDFDKNDAVVSDDVHNGFEQAKLISVLKKIGFVNAKAETFYHGKNMFMQQDASLFLLDAVK